MLRIFLPFCALALLIPATAQETPPESVRVAVLGYHEFSSDQPPTAMRMPTDKFRKQMQAISDLGIPVIDLESFLKWKRGEGELPPRSIMITIDDGWKSVYSEAFPILKEFGYPFTLYLYKNYVDGGGRALTSDMIREMQEHGGSIGSHSVSHPLPSKVKAEASKGGKSFDAYLRRELGESKTFLEGLFKQEVTTYAYPGGYYDPAMFPLADEFGYEFLFTVHPGKVRHSSPNRTLPRYVILGNHDEIFRMATTFRDASGRAVVPGAIVQTTPHPVNPAPGAMVESRLPVVSADLSKVEGLVPESLVMRVGGFGKVPATFDPGTGKLSWKINRRLRQRTCEVSVQWRLEEKQGLEDPMNWTFLIDREAAYQIGAGS
jgi:peptidoglycan/xylan/chitin deacetylase (PgdA/CDA1 family)